MTFYYPLADFEPYGGLYLCFGLNLLGFNHGVLAETLFALQIHFVVHPGHGFIHLLFHLRHLQLIQMIIQLILR